MNDNIHYIYIYMNCRKSVFCNCRFHICISQYAQLSSERTNNFCIIYINQSVVNIFAINMPATFGKKTTAMFTYIYIYMYIYIYVYMHTYIFSKLYFICIIRVERLYCQLQPGILLFLCPTQKMLSNIVLATVKSGVFYKVNNEYVYMYI